MKQLFFATFILFFFSLSYAQHRGMNYALKIISSEESHKSTPLPLLVKGNISELKRLQSVYNYTFHYSAGEVASISASADAISKLLETKVVRFAELVKSRLRAMNDTMLVRNRIKPVKQGASPLSQAYNGEGVLMGIIDTGTDFNHPDFKDSLGHTRIKFLWDQVPSSGSAVPQPYGYGIEWTETQINAAQCTHSDVAYYGHGTSVSGIAAGNGLATGHHQGSASKSDMIVVAIDFNKPGPTVADAVQYIFDKATLLGKPCVINASLGDYYGSHDGTDLQTQLIENNLKNISGRAMVSAVGNAGGYKYHVKTQTQSTDTVFTWLHNGSTQEEYWLYGDSAQIVNLQVAVGADRNNFSNLGRIGFKPYAYGLTSLKSDTLWSNGHRIGVIKNASSINSSGVYELYLQIIADTANLFWRIETTGQGLHHAWNFDFVSSGLPSSSQYPNINHYIMPDTISTMVSGFQCSDEITTVGAFLNLSHYYDVQDSLRNNGGVAGTFSPFSSSGPTRDGRIRPDVCASGNFIFSALVLSFKSVLIANTPTSVAQDSMHVLGGGTSAASPVVAGLAALYLQRHPYATSADVRQAITSCAYQDNYTGFSLPNNVWGYGKLDGLATMTCGEVLTGIHNYQKPKQITAVPNPFSTQTRLEFERPVKADLMLYSLDGKLLFCDHVEADHYDLSIEKLGNQQGLVYLLKLVQQDGVSVIKLVRE